jgi:glucose-6-phosphate dehydrogenase assembly protein OpcA
VTYQSEELINSVVQDSAVLIEPLKDHKKRVENKDSKGTSKLQNKIPYMAGEG